MNPLTVVKEKNSPLKIATLTKIHGKFYQKYLPQNYFKKDDRNAVNALRVVKRIFTTKNSKPYNVSPLT